MRQLLAPLFTLYAAVLLLLLWLWHLPLIALLPELRQRRRLARLNMRLALLLMGIRVNTQGFEQLPQSPSIVVANHGSYLDGPLLNAVLPDYFRIVIKNEAAQLPLVGWYLRRIGSLFVERHNRAGAIKDSNHIQSVAANGHSIAMFPEGGFSTDQGLARFKTGAFTTAAKLQLPVFPIAINGTRKLMHPSSNTLWPGKVIVRCLPAIYSADSSRAEIRRNCQVARDRIELCLEAT